MGCLHMMLPKTPVILLSNILSIFSTTKARGTQEFKQIEIIYLRNMVGCNFLTLTVCCVSKPCILSILF